MDIIDYENLNNPEIPNPIMSYFEIIEGRNERSISHLEAQKKL